MKAVLAFVAGFAFALLYITRHIDEQARVFRALAACQGQQEETARAVKGLVEEADSMRVRWGR